MPNPIVMPPDVSVKGEKRHFYFWCATCGAFQADFLSVDDLDVNADRHAAANPGHTVKKFQALSLIIEMDSAFVPPIREEIEF